MRKATKIHRFLETSHLKNQEDGRVTLRYISGR
jgi:hypothetical protein